MVGDSRRCQQTPTVKELQANGVVLVFVGAAGTPAFVVGGTALAAGVSLEIGIESSVQSLWRSIFHNPTCQ